MKQASLFDDKQAGTSLPLVGVPGSRTALSPAQKLFNKLIERIGTQRQLLQQWRDFVPQYQQRYAADVAPLQGRLREKRVAMVRLLDQAMGHKSLGKSQRAKVADILLGQVSELLADGPDDELVRLHDKYSDVSFEEAQREDLDLAQAMAGSIFGVDLGDDHGATTAEELAQRIAEKVRAAKQAEQAQPPARGRRKSAKAAAREAQREQAAQGASRSLREVYRLLASELHPDRETDAAQRARKTALMQQVNQAYAAGDLLALLELQLRIEQIDPGALAGLAQDRLAHYNLVLQQQLQRLQDELDEVRTPFVMGLGGRVPREFTPDLVLQGLAADVHQLRTTLRHIETDLVALQDIKVLKNSLRHYRVGQNDDDDIDMLESLLLDALQDRPRRR
ncbi:MAG: J domain-containing protein [Rubrivivax sp.]|nr:J domain-containing protein [Rubrivivax sp.]